MEKSIKELKKEYQVFLDSVPQNLERMTAILNLDNLTFEKKEINNSVKLYCKYYTNPEDIGFSKIEFENIIDSYWGEAFRYYNGGEWVLNLSKKDEAYGTPTIEKWGGENYPWSRISPKVWRMRVQNFGLEDMLPATYIFGN